MTTLVVEELRASPLVQSFVIEKRLIVHAVRPYLYTHNFPAGTFTVSLLTSTDDVIAYKTFSSSAIYAGLGTVNAYAHAFYKIEFDGGLPLVAGTYKIKLSSSGYTYISSSYLGWVKEHEDLKVNTTYVITGAEQNPLSFELWSYEL